MNLLEWISKEIKSEPDRIKIRLNFFFLSLLGIPLFIVIFLLVTRGIIDGFSGLSTYFILMISIAAIRAWALRSNPNASAYYIFNSSHFSLFSKIVLICAVVFTAIFIIFVTSCQSKHPVYSPGMCITSLFGAL